MNSEKSNCPVERSRDPKDISTALDVTKKYGARIQKLLSGRAQSRPEIHFSCFPDVVIQAGDQCDRNR